MAQQPALYVYQEYPKWVEKDGKKFIVQNEVEYLEHFPGEPTPPPATVSAPDGQALREDGPTIEEFVAAGYKATDYPPEGFAPRSTPEQVKAAIDAQAASAPPSEPVAAPEGQVPQADASPAPEAAASPQGGNALLESAAPTPTPAPDPAASAQGERRGRRSGGAHKPA